MFRKREKKYFPPGTFIPMPARIFSIIQLCLAFSLFAWITSQPFMGDLFLIKSRALLYENVLGIGPSQNEKGSLIERNGERFALLPDNIRLKIESDYALLQQELKLPFSEKFHKMLILITLKTPPFELAWIFFSILVPVFLLMRIEGAIQGVWLLLLVTSCFAIDNRLNGASYQTDAVTSFFPTEQLIFQKYVQEEVSSNIFEQQKQLTNGWYRYLIEEWAHKIPSKDSSIFAEQAEAGLFAFHVARLNQMENIADNLSTEALPKKKAYGILALFLLWHISYAWVAQSLFPN